MSDGFVTGVGPVTALGCGQQSYFRRLLAGESGLTTLPDAVTREGPLFNRVGAVVDSLPASPLSRLDPRPRAVLLAQHAVRLALVDAALELAACDRTRIGVAVGTGCGNLDVVESAVSGVNSGERPSPLAGFRGFHHAAACEVAREHDLHGPIATLSSGCNSGVDAIGLGLDWIRLGRADIVICGGTEAEITPGFLATMNASRALQVRHNGNPAAASRPFDRNRDGNVPGEGAAFLILESAASRARRGVSSYARLLACSSRAAGMRPPYNPFAPPLDPLPIERSLRTALADCQRAPEELAAISCNGSSSVTYDKLEALAIRGLLGQRERDVPVHSIKGALGQCGAVTSALQVLTACLSIRHGVLPPTINCDDPDPEVTFDLVRGNARPIGRGLILTHAIGFGGSYHASAVLTPEDEVNGPC